MSLQLEIVTPERLVLKETVDHVVLPTQAGGELDVLPGHVPLMAMIEPGALHYYQGDKVESIAIARGFIEVIDDSVKVLTEAAIDVEEIDLSSLEAARARAEEELAEARARGEDPAIMEELETKARFTVVQRLVREMKR
jgi:F-type H+-transporting ATPase subunit epsilon